MFKLREREYKIIYLDTNILSTICKEYGFYTKFLKLFPPSSTILSYSAYTMFEISRSPALYKEFKSQFSVLPSLVLKSNTALIELEKQNYGSLITISPVLFNPLSIKTGQKPFDKDVLNKLLEAQKVKNSFDWWNRNLTVMQKDLVSLEQSKNVEESKKVKYFVEQMVVKQLRLRFPSFYNGLNKDTFKIETFPSLITMSYVTFYKFYSDNRKPLHSDLMDIIISSTLPYVETFITERNMKDIIAKTKRQTGILDKLEVLTLNDIRQ